MLLQSYCSKVLRFFPTWPDNMPARFANLRAVGAFLVSSAIKGGRVQYVFIESEKGRDCTVRNPWPGKEVTLYRNNQKAEAFTGETFTFKTSPGEMIALSGDGLSPAQMKDREKQMRQTMLKISNR